MKNYYTPRDTEPDVKDRWMVPYADLVTLLLALFIVLFSAADKQRATAIATAFNSGSAAGSGILDGTVDRATEGLVKSILSDPVLVRNSKLRTTDKEITVSLSEAALFEPGESEVATSSVKTIESLSAKLKGVKGKIRIEGHTDSVPISNARYRSNWELSTSRAASVLMLLVKNGVDPKSLSAAGYGGFRPIADNTTPEGRRLNRRVDVVVSAK